MPPAPQAAGFPRLAILITIPKAQRLLEVTYHTARRNIYKLVDAGILSQVGEEDYNKTYVAGEILDIIGTTTQNEQEPPHLQSIS